MRKKAIFNYFNDSEYDDDSEYDSEYDFSAVDLRGENHKKDLDADLENFSFDDDSYGDLPFEDDDEMVEEDFSLRTVIDDPDDDFSDEKNIDLKEEQFVLEHPDDAPDFTEDFLDDADDDNMDFDFSDEDNHKADTVDEDISDDVSDDGIKDSVTRRTVPKIRNSAFQPLLLINRSKHSFDPSKRLSSNEKSEINNDSDGFEDIDNDFSDDDDVEVISDDITSSQDESEIEEIADDTDFVDSENPGDELPENLSDELTDDSDDKSTDDSDLDNTMGSVVIDDDENNGSGEDNKVCETVIFQDENMTSAAPDSEVKSGPIFFFDDNMDDLPDGVKEELTSDVSADSGSEYEDDNTSDEEFPLPGDEKKTENVSSAPSDVDKKISDKKLARKKRKRKKKIKSFTKEVISWSALVVSAFLIAIIINLYVARPSVVSGRSMMPTLEDGDTIIISQLPYMLGEVEYGDIVVIDRDVDRERTFMVELIESLKYNVLTQSLFDENDLNSDIFWVKRIIGKPGDIIEFYQGKVYRNGELLNEGYIFTQDVTSYPEGQQIVVKEGCVFVMGDNRNESMDSRMLAMHGEQIAIDHIVGKLISK